MPPEDVSPLVTKCWSNAGTGSLSLSDDYLVIYAEVKQGNKPVILAEVKAVIEREGASPLEVILQDNGANPDITEQDGVYSRFVTRYP